MTAEKLLFDLLRCEIKGEVLPDGFVLTDENLRELYRLSKRHDSAHLIGDALFRNSLLTDGKAKDAFKKQIALAVLRVERQTAELKNICAALDAANIPHILLKGAILRDYYPKPWMRTSCDIDILIHEEDIEKATDSLTRSGFETDGKRNYHDVHFYNGDVHLELHFTICESNKNLDAVLSKVWDYAEKTGDYEYRELPEFFVFHHIAHAAYHFLSGGCGIKPFTDLWILKQKNLYEEEKLLPLLEKSGLVEFYDAACKLTDVWLNGKEHDDLTLRMEEYVLSGGVYGNSGNASAVGAATNKGKGRYLLRIVFPPYRVMCNVYPSLVKCKILLPFCYIHRIFAKLFGKDRKAVKKRNKERINSTMSQSKENISSVNKLLTDLGLNK